MAAQSLAVRRKAEWLEKSANTGSRTAAALLSVGQQFTFADDNDMCDGMKGIADAVKRCEKRQRQQQKTPFRVSLFRHLFSLERLRVRAPLSLSLKRGQTGINRRRYPPLPRLPTILCIIGNLFAFAALSRPERSVDEREKKMPRMMLEGVLSVTP